MSNGKSTGAKRTTKKKTTKKKTAKKKSARGKTTKKKTTKKKTTKKKTTKRKASKKVTRKTATKKTARKKVAKKTAKRKTAAKKATPQKKAARRASDPGCVIKVGFHLDNTRTVVAASCNGDSLDLKKDVFANIVGYLKKRGGGRRSDRTALVSEEALHERRHLDIRRPIRAGAVIDVEACQQLAAYMASVINPVGSAPLWGVVSVPAGATAEEREKARRAMSRVLDRTLLVPEPYLAAEGMHLEPECREEGLRGELTRRSLVVDIGSNRTDLSVLRGEAPGQEAHIMLEQAGNYIDAQLEANGPFYYPGLEVTRTFARQMKEEQAFVGAEECDVPRMMEMSSELFFLREVLRTACGQLLRAVVEACCTLLERCGADAPAIARNIIVTGGGSRIRNLPGLLEQALQELGHPAARVRFPEEPRYLVAHGARRLAESLSEEEWAAGTETGELPFLARELARATPEPALTPILAGAPSSVPEASLLDLAHSPAEPEPEPVGTPESTLFGPVDVDELDFFKHLSPEDQR